MNSENLPYLVGGGYALAHYTGIRRNPKDFDVFTRKADAPRLMQALARAGFDTDLTFAHWLAKARCNGHHLDIIFSSGNGVAAVDDEWFAHAEPAAVLDRPVRLCPVEETIWSKSFVMERERYDGADVAHLLRARAAQIDWARLLCRFSKEWRVLFSHLTLFGFIYPHARRQIPAWVLHNLLARMQEEFGDAGPSRAPSDAPENGHAPLCHGTLLSRAEYIVDVSEWAYGDARLAPHGSMSAGEIEVWTAPVLAGGR